MLESVVLADLKEESP